MRSDTTHSADQLKAATRQLLTEAVRKGLVMTLWRSTPIGHWLEMDSNTIRLWLTTIPG